MTFALHLFEIYRSSDGSEWSLNRGDVVLPEWMYEDVDMQPMELIASFWARDWEEAKELYRMLQDQA